MARANPLESSVEGHLEKRCAALDVFLTKNTGRNGMPDRLLIFRSRHWFLELKRPGKRPTELQEAVAQKLRSHGAVTLCADTKPRVDEILSALTGNLDPPAKLAYGRPGQPWDPD